MLRAPPPSALAVVATALATALAVGPPGAPGRLAAQQRLEVGVCAPQWRLAGDSIAAGGFRDGIVQRLSQAARPPLAARALATCVPEAATGLDYVVQITLVRAEEDASLFEAQIRVLSAGWRLWGSFTAQSPRVDGLVDEAAPKLTLTLTQPIRIAALRFPQRSGDTIRFGGFSTALPHMLREGLLNSSRIVLVDQDSTARAEMEKQIRDSGALDPNTSLRFGRLLGANYLITGDYLELDGSLWIDVRCVSVETGQVVSSRGVVVDTPTVRSVYRSMTEVADELRASISEDFLAQPAGPRYLAVSGFVPYPDTPENRRVLDAVVRNVARKLRATGRRDLYVQDTPERMDDVIHAGSDRWQISAQRGADYLLSLRMDRTHRDSLVVDLDVFDPARPRDAGPTWHVTVPVDDVDSTLVPVLAQVLESLVAPDAPLSPEQRAALSDHPYRGLVERIGFPVSLGLSYQQAKELFLDVSLGIELEGGMSLVLDDRAHWSVGPRLTVFLLGIRGAPKVIGLDVMGTGTYHFRPHLTRNPYATLGLGYLGVTRFGTGALQFDTRLGASLAVGFEQTLASARRVAFEVEWRQAFGTIPAKTLGTFRYEGGRPGGLSVTLGTTLH